MATILAVDDNPLTRAVIRTALEGEGYRVVEAVDGRAALERIRELAPDLILQNLLLPDCDGGDLLRRMRALPEGARVPIVGLSGHLDRDEPMASPGTGYTGILFKPIEPTDLLRAVRRHLSTSPRHASSVGQGRRVLVVDDDADQRQLLRIHLSLRGFEVTTAEDGEEALEMMRSHPPDAVVSDVMMPRRDGFGLCLEMRRDKDLVRIPVVLTSAAYCDDADRALGDRVGASAYVARTPAFEGVLDALAHALEADVPGLKEASAAIQREHARRVAHQLELHSARETELARSRAVQLSVLTLLGTLASERGDGENLDRTLEDMLRHCVDFLGASVGALYEADEASVLALRACTPCMSEPLRGRFGHAAFIDEAAARGTTLVFPSPAVPSEVSAAVLAALQVKGAVLVPGSGGWRGAVLLTASWEAGLTSGSLPATSAVAAQLCQAAALAHSIARCKRAESTLRESETMLRSVLESARDAIVSFDQDGRIVSWNGGAEQLYGYPTAEVVGQHVLRLLPSRYRADQQQQLDVAGRIATQDLASVFELEGLRRDGTEFPIELCLSSWRTSDERYFTVVVRDITARKELERQLLHAQKMEALGTLCGGVAHDFNNLLTAISGYAELLLLDGREDQKEFLKEIVAASNSAADLTSQLLTFSRHQVVTTRVVDLNGVLSKLDKLLHRLIGEDVDLRLEPAEEPCRVRVDPTQMEQVVMNLVVNARDAMPQGGRLAVRLREIYLPQETRRSGVALAAGSYAVLTVSDTGVGIARDVLAHIFEPFFTTKPTGKGTGLGLATVYGIVKQSGGEITVDSEPGRGTTFTAYLPSALEAASPLSADRPPHPRRGRETILVAEDEERVRTYVHTLLTRSGYRVLMAADGGEALRVCAAESGPIDLLLTDTVMPVCGGRHLAEQVTARRPDVRVMFMSGYTDDALLNHGVSADEVAFVQKPFRPRDLLLKIREVLDASPPS